ncbi:hypothetical protein BROUX41_001312 [Berkeleyomyces rouxiae]|uniref:uncharacterized protein n=1 Tax=Berkeleyomyces rouxiae TaxID=2035830 RepID=UPI003B7ACA2C
MVQTSSVVKASVATAAAGLVGKFPMPMSCAVRGRREEEEGGEAKRAQPSSSPSGPTALDAGIPPHAMNRLLTSTATAPAAAALSAAYVIYFDYMRRGSSEFRRSLRRNERRKARVEREKADADVFEKRQRVKIALMQALAQGFPTDVAQKEAYFMEHVSIGEQLSANPAQALDAALAFYKALKVYPTPSDLIRIYDQTVPKHVLDILAEIIALDGGLSSSSLFGPGPGAAAAAASARASPAASGAVEDVSGNVDSDPEEVEPELEEESESDKPVVVESAEAVAEPAEKAAAAEEAPAAAAAETEPETKVEAEAEAQPKVEPAAETAATEPAAAPAVPDAPTSDSEDAGSEAELVSAPVSTEASVASLSSTDME